MLENVDPVTRAVIHLLRQEPYFGGMLQTIRRTYSDDIKTADVSVTSGGAIRMRFNRAFADSLSDLERQAVIKHELSHITFGHLTRARRQDMPDAKRANYAMDMAINQHISGLPESAVLPHKMGLPKGKTADWYYAALPQSDSDDSDDGQTLDEHGEWGDAPCDEIIEAAAKRCVESGKNAAVAQGGWGNVPSDMRQAIEETLAVAPLNWKTLLRRFAADAARAGTTSTRKKRNRRYGLTVPGRKVIRKARIAVAVDTSGSIYADPAVLGSFFDEIKKIAKHAEVTIIECDARVGNVYPYKGAQPTEVSGGGGTRFEPAFVAAADIGIDALVYLTDGWASFPERRPGWPKTLWVITDTARMDLKRFGRDVHMDLSQ